MGENMETSKRTPEIKFNNNVKLIVSDVDETVVDLYLPAEPEMTKELTSLLQEGKSLFFVTGQSIKSLQWRIVDQIPKELRKKILIGHCSGAEVWGYNENGDLRDKPYYSIYDTAMNQEQKNRWREIVGNVNKEFNLEIYPTMPIEEFKKKAGDNPKAVMFEDRGPQITLEMVNGYNLTEEQASLLNTQIPENNGIYDLRMPIIAKAQQLIDENNLPITPRIAGVFAIDFALRGVNKTTAIKHVLENEEVLNNLGLTKTDLENPDNFEIWGDKFSITKGGTDRHMSEALPKAVRSVDFREENPSEFLPGYNIVVWNGKEHLHHGLLEYLKLRKK